MGLGLLRIFSIFCLFPGGAGSMFGKLKESSRAVMGTLLASKDLDFHLLTARIAAMSCPSEGLDMTSGSKNQIEDIRYGIKH